MNVPVEICNEFLKYFANDTDRDTLRSCSLVCKTWIPLAQRRIFHSFSACTFAKYPTRNASQWKRLLDVLINSPHLAIYCHEIRLDRWSTFSERDASAILAALIQQFTRTRRLSVALPTDSRDSCWKDIPADVKAALQKIIAQPSFEGLFLCGNAFSRATELASIIRHCSSNLRVLDIRHSGISIANTEPVAVEKVELRNLEEFIVHESITSFFREPLCIFQNLRAYTHELPYLQHRHPHIPDCILNTISTFVFLLDFRKTKISPQMESQPIHLGRFKDLRFLILEADLTLWWRSKQHGRWPAAISTIGHFLDPIPPGGLPPLERFTVKIATDYWVSAKHWDQVAWDALDTKLAPLVEDGSLQEVAILLRYSLSAPRPSRSSDDISIHAAAALVRLHFGKLDRAGALRMEVEDLLE